MQFVTLEDATGLVEAVVLPKRFPKAGEYQHEWGGDTCVRGG